jgi:hypothetical protein
MNAITTTAVTIRKMPTRTPVFLFMLLSSDIAALSDGAMLSLSFVPHFI